LAGKRLELLKEAIPSLTHIAAFRDSFESPELKSLSGAAASLGVKVDSIDLSPDYDLERAFRTAKASKVEAIAVLTSAALYVRSKQIGAMALKNRIPTIGSYRDLVDAGGFLSYSTDLKDGFYRSAYFVDRLLKGSRVSDLPFEQTANVKLVVNLRTAEVIGIRVPQSILLRADDLVR
jgi:putative ABC transport system substrate-binding protein